MLIRSARVSTGRGRCLVWLQPPGKIGRDQKGGGSVFAAADSLMRGQALHLSVSVVPADQTTASQHLAVLVLAMLAAAGWIATHRYPGLWHDAVLYAAQAIYRLDPAPFTKDLFFAYGSQDGFTAFSPLYAFAIANLGLPTASLLLLGAAHVAWLAAGAFLLRGFLAGWAFWAGLILVAVLPPTYGPFDVFSYGESFLTARSWAEPAALLAVACIVRGHRIAAIASLAFAAAMHPVMAFPAALFVFFFGFRGRQQLLLGLAGLATVAMLVQRGIPPFGGLTHKVDPLWLGLLIERSPILFLDQWPGAAYREPIFYLVLLTTAALVAAPGNRRLWWSAIGVLLSGAGLALLAILWPGVLLLQMQPWRVLWLAKILTIAAAVVVVRDSSPWSPYGCILLGALAACAFTVDSSGLACALPLSALLVARQRWAIDPHLPPSIIRVAWCAIALIIGERIFWAAMISAVSLDFTEASFARLTLGNRIAIFFKESAWFVFPPLMLGTWWLLRHRPRSSFWLAPVVAGVLLFFIVQWRQISYNGVAEEKLQERGNAELVRIIKPQHLTYWGDGHARLWLMLHRASYASSQQAAGIVFSRQTAIEAERRLARLERLGLADSSFKRDALPVVVEESTELSTRRLDALIHVCHDPILDFVVLSQKVVGATPLASVRLYPSGPESRLYACAELRAFPDPCPSAP